MPRLRVWLPVLVWCSVIFAFSSIRGTGQPPGPDWPLRKLAHMVEFGVLWRLAFRAFGRDLSPRAAAGAALAFSLLYAASDEWHQSFVPFREPRALDVGFDAAGALLALWARRRAGALR